MGKVNLPEPSFFTVEQLAGRWGVPVNMVGHYLIEQHLRPAFRPANPPRIHALYVHSLMLQAGEDDWVSHHRLPISAHATISAQVSGRPVSPGEWVYFDLTNADRMGADDHRELYAVLSTHGFYQDYGDLLQPQFMLFDGTPVTVVAEAFTRVPQTEPEELNEIWIDCTATFLIPLEEVRRFEGSRDTDISHTMKPDTQQSWLSKRLQANGVDPEAVPRHRGGKPGLKAEIKAAALQERPDLFTSDSFNHAWKKLPKVDP